MAVQVLGKVAYFNKGAYNSQTNYEINDVVSYNGSSYVSLNDNNQGNLPTNTNYWSVVAEKGDKGDTGKPFVIEKTYSTIESMVADYDNMNVNDYVMIQGSIEEQENATLWTKREVEVSPYKWAYLADFSGASGITGATPNIHIGTVTEGNEPSVTRRSGSSNENPILDFVLKTGAKGDTGATGNGISSFEKTSTSGLVDTYTITFTNGTSTTIEVTNGRGIVSIAKTSSVDYVDTYTITYNDGTTSTFEVANSEVTEEEFNDVVDELNYLYDDLPKVEGEGTNLTLNNTRKGKMSNVLRGNLNQKTSILPEGYTQVDYIESSGTQYIDTGIYPYKTKTEITFQLLDDYASTTENKMLAGITGTSRYIIAYLYYGRSPQTISPANLNNTIIANINMDSKKHILVYNDENNNILYDGNEVSLVGTLSDLATQNPLSLTLFGRNNGSNTDLKSSFKLYNCKITNKDTNTLERNFIPCYRNSDNEVGLYDIVNDVFYTKQGTGSFTYGSVVEIPNPDYPQDVHVVSGDNNISIETNNLFELNNDYLNASWDGGSPNTMTIVDNKLQSTANYQEWRAKSMDLPHIKPNNTYILSLDILSVTSSNGDSVVQLFTKKGSTPVVKVFEEVWKVGKHTKSFTIDDVDHVGLSISSARAGTVIVGNIQIEKGSTVTTYQKYEGEKYPINLGTMELCKIGNYQDYIYKDNGKWYKHSEIGKVVLNGSETYDPSSTNTSGKYRIAYKGISNIILAPPNASTKGNILCDYFEVKTANQTYQCQQGISVATNGDIQIYNLNNEIGSVNAFKTWLSTNNTSIYYVLATPTNTEITDQTLIAQLDNFEKAISYNTQTNISQENNDLPFIISASAFMSLKYLFNNLETRVAELEASEPSEL